MTLDPSRLAPADARPWMLAFAVLGLPLAVLLALLVPFGEVADESAHLLRAVALTQGQIIGHREPLPFSDGSTRIVAGVTVDPAWERLSRSRPDVSAEIPVPRGLDERATGSVFFPLYTIGTYCPVFYVPAAIGLRLGAAFGLTDGGAARLGRFAGLAAYGLIGLAALALARRGRVLLFCVLILPMSLSLAASFNHDGLIIAATVLAAALLSRRAPDDAGPSPRSLGVAAVLIALVVLAKPPYAPLAAMLFVPWPADRRMIGVFQIRRAALAALVVLPGVAWFGYASAVVATPVPRYPYEAGPLWTGARPAIFDGTDTLAQARVLLAEPIRLLTVPARFLLTIKHVVVLAREVVGTFGLADRPLPGALYLVWLAALVAPLAAMAGRARAVRRLDAGLLAGSALLVVWLVILSQYLSWTNVGERAVYGPQGRYLLPILPMLALAVPRPCDAPHAGWRRVAVTAPIVAAALSLVVVPFAVARMF